MVRGRDTDARPEAPPVREVVERLAREYPDATTELDHENAFQLLVATVLSAQTTDVRVNEATPELFRRWPDPEALAGADQAQVQAVIRPVGMAPTKSTRIIALAQGLLDRFGGEVPEGQEQLESLPGVGRKTALVVRGVQFGADAFAVDTHVMRTSRRLGWTGSKDPAKVEEDVLARVAGEAGDGPAIDLTRLSLRLILLGRRICHARTPDCPECPLQDICPKVGVA